MIKARERIYSQYVDAWSASTAPKSTIELNNRAPTMNFLIHSFFPSNKNAHIVDLGCGHGTLVHFAHKAGYSNTSGVDVSGQQVELAHSLGIKNIKQGDLMNTLQSMPAGSVDVVVAFDVIEHFTKDELIDFIDAVHRVLKADGRWIIHAPNGDSPFFGAVRYGDFTHELAFTQTSINQLLTSSKFKKVICKECAPQAYSLTSFIRMILWKIIRLVLRFTILAESGDLGGDAILTRNLYAVAFK